MILTDSTSRPISMAFAGSGDAGVTAPRRKGIQQAVVESPTAASLAPSSGSAIKRNCSRSARSARESLGSAKPEILQGSRAHFPILR
jgi:hypothetical protein